MDKNSPEKKFKIDLKAINAEIPSEREKLNGVHEFSSKGKPEMNRFFDDSSTQRETVSSKRENQGGIALNNGQGEVKNPLPSPNNNIKDSSRISRDEEESKTQLERQLENVDGEFSEMFWTRTIQKLYILLNDSESSNMARFIAIFSILLIITDVLFLILETEKSLDLPKGIWNFINSITTIYFLIEMVLRISTHRAFGENFKEFLKKSFNYVDVLALAYSIAESILYLNDITFSSRIKIFRMFIVLRLIRIFRFSTFSKGVNILIEGVTQSLQALSILLFFTMICVILIASFIYFVEKEFSDDSTDLKTIPEAIWWAIITITTVGYGDIVPVTFLGKVIGSVSLIFGVLLLSLPVAIIGNKFQEIYLKTRKEEIKNSRDHAKTLFNSAESRDERDIYRIMLKLNELEEVNEVIEKCLQENQFLYRSITRDAQQLIKKIELEKGFEKKPKNKKNEFGIDKERIIKIKREILKKRASQD